MANVKANFLSILGLRYQWQDWYRNLTDSFFSDNLTDQIIRDLPRGVGKTTYLETLAFCLALYYEDIRIGLVSYRNPSMIISDFEVLKLWIYPGMESVYGSQFYLLKVPQRRYLSNIYFLDARKPPSDYCGKRFDFLLHDDIQNPEYLIDYKKLLTDCFYFDGSTNAAGLNSKQICLYTSKENEKKTFDYLDWEDRAELQNLEGVI